MRPRRFSHGQLCTFHVELSDGVTSMEMVIVSNVLAKAKGCEGLQRLTRSGGRSSGFSACPPDEFRKRFGVEPWEWK